MEFIFELILELALEGSIEASKNTKLPKPIRYFFICLIVLFFTAVIGIVFLTGILIFKDNLVAGLVIMAIGIFLLAASVMKFKKVYLKKKDN